MGTALSTEFSTPFDDAVNRTRKALREQGFGVLTEIDVQATLKQKLGEEMEDYLIPGAAIESLATSGSLSRYRCGMSSETQPVTILPVSECWELMSSVSLGRLVTVVDGQPEIFPVNFVVQNRSVLLRTAEGTKLVSSVINHSVLFEVDDHNVAEGWSVIVKGTAHTLHTSEEIEEAERAQLLPWTATVKTHYVRIRPVSVTGRRFIFGPEPDRTFS